MRLDLNFRCYISTTIQMFDKVEYISIRLGASMPLDVFVICCGHCYYSEYY